MRMSEADRGTYKAMTVSFVADHPMYGQSRHCPGQLPGQGSPVQTAAMFRSAVAVWLS